MQKEAKPIWVESILTDEEYKICARKYPNTYTKGPNKVQMFDCEFKWRYKMGSSMSHIEIKIFNKRLEGLAEMIEKTKRLNNQLIEQGL
jgi:hypothetical protein